MRIYRYKIIYLYPILSVRRLSYLLFLYLSRLYSICLTRKNLGSDVKKHALINVQKYTNRYDSDC